MKLYAVSCAIIKSGWTETNFTSYLHYAFAESENDAKASLIAKVLSEQKPEDLRGVQAVEIPTEVISKHLKLIPELAP